MKIALLEPLGVNRELIDSFQQKIASMGHSLTVYTDRDPSPEGLIRRSAGMDAVIIANTPFPKEVIAASPDLKYIDVAFTGVDHICLDACRERGIQVSNASGYSDIAVAELAFGMMLGLYRRLQAADAAARAGKDKTGLIGFELAGKTVGVVGTGKIGSRAARLALAFGCRVAAYSHSEKPELTALGVEYLPLDKLMGQSDIVTLHIPSTPETKGLISREMIGRMKPSAILINTARGPVVDSAALADALNEGRIAGAGIDVFEMEPPIPGDHPLLHAKNALLAPHVAFATNESLERRAVIVFDNLLAWLDGEIKNSVTGL